MIVCKLTSLLNRRSVKLEQLIEDLDVSPAVVRKLGDGSATRIEFDVLEALCDYLDCEVGELLVHEG